MLWGKQVLGKYLESSVELPCTSLGEADVSAWGFLPRYCLLKLCMDSRIWSICQVFSKKKVLGFWSLIMFRHERKGKVARLRCEREPAAMIQHGICGLSTWRNYLLWICHCPPTWMNFLIKGRLYFRVCGGSRCCDDGRFDAVVILSVWSC